MPKKKNLQTQNKGNKKKKKKKAKEEGEKVEKGKDEKEEEVQEEEEKEKGEDRDPNEGDDCGKEEEEEEVILLKPNTGLMKIQTKKKDVMTTIEEEDVEDDFCPSLSKSLVFEAKNKSVLSPDAKPFVMKPNSTSKSSFFRSSLNLETVYENKIISTTMDINKNLILGNKIPFESPQPGPVLKHPLSHSWTFWWFTGERRSWEDNMVQVMSFDTIEDFWSLYHHVILPSELKSGQDYFLFKNGIKPMWEDEANHRGGSWRFAQERKHKIEHLDKRWLELSIFVVGEDFNTYGAAGDDAVRRAIASFFAF